MLRPVLRWFFGQPTPGLVKVLLYRYEFFGKPVGRYGHAALRGPSRWSVGERELFAAVVSAGNRCGYCARVHGAIARLLLGARVVDDVVHGGALDCVNPGMAAMVPFLRRLSAGPDQVTASDVLALRCAGLDDKQIMDAVHTAVLLESATGWSTRSVWSRWVLTRTSALRVSCCATATTDRSSA
jgi:uncharacterized peroxidase-related enzyme